MESHYAIIGGAWVCQLCGHLNHRIDCRAIKGSEHAIARLYKGVLKLDKELNLDAVAKESDPIVILEDSRLSVIEHVCHELGHAALLRMELYGTDLSTRVAKQINVLGYLKEQLNELHTFAVVMGVFQRLGMPMDEAAAEEACEIQICEWERQEFPQLWKKFSETTEYTEAVRKVFRRIRDVS